MGTHSAFVHPGLAMLRQLFPIALLTVFIASGSETRAQGVAFPEGTGVIDVTAEPWNFDNTGTEDITAKFQQLVDQTIPRKTITSPEGYWPFIIYFPNGVYRITDSIVGAVLNNRAALGGLVIQGESQHGTILRLDDNAAGFGNRNSPKVFLDYFAGNATNNAFINMLENLTLDVGSGNPGAIGLRFHANNTGAVCNVSILSSDPNGAGFAGIEAVKNTNGPWLIRGLEIRGFEYAMNLGNVENNRHMVSIQDLTLFNQSVAGIRLNQFKVNIFNMRSYNNVPLVVDLHPSGMINIIDAEWIVPEGQTTSEAAIRSTSPVYLRNIINQGYPAIVSTASDVLLAAIEPGEEWFNRPRNSLWEDSPAQSLQLEILQAPEPEWAPHEDWAIVSPTPSQPNEVAAIRAALASGKSTIVFQPGTYRINDIIRIPPHVQRLAGQWALFRLETGLNGDGRAAFELGPSNHETVVVEKIRGRFDAQANPNPLVLNASHGNLVLRDIFWVSGPILRTEPTRGRVFIENVHSLPGSQNNARNSPAYVLRGQAAWAWQWNPEMLFPHIMSTAAAFLRSVGKQEKCVVQLSM
ncbi:MAG: glycoside hydrolase family 55 protein [Verrucomicrobia bacterium]|nr:glycoside hydrolase family 55 protein [Verrucomicrobiota bacterium]